MQRINHKITDAAGREWTFITSPRRVVSLVPCLTHDMVQMGFVDRMVGRTRYCISPAEVVAGIPAVGGVKDPDVAAIISLKPDLVLMDKEENRWDDARRLLDAGVRVLTFLPRDLGDVVQILKILARIMGAGQDARRRISLLESAVTETQEKNKQFIPVFCPIWKNPYMGFNSQTYIASILHTVGFENVFSGWPERYFPVEPDHLSEIRCRDLVVLLPTEPYSFQKSHMNEISRELMIPIDRVRLVQGEYLTWYGLMTMEALKVLQEIHDSYMI